VAWRWQPAAVCTVVNRLVITCQLNLCCFRYFARRSPYFASRSALPRAAQRGNVNMWAPFTLVEVYVRRVIWQLKRESCRRAIPYPRWRQVFTACYL
jgi:hypothetical protein